MKKTRRGKTEFNRNPQSRCKKCYMQHSSPWHSPKQTWHRIFFLLKWKNVSTWLPPLISEVTLITTSCDACALRHRAHLSNSDMICAPVAQDIFAPQRVFEKKKRLFRSIFIIMQKSQKRNVTISFKSSVSLSASLSVGLLKVYLFVHMLCLQLA
jgi:hypothetical protein